MRLTSWSATGNVSMGRCSNQAQAAKFIAVRSAAPAARARSNRVNAARSAGFNSDIRLTSILVSWVHSLQSGAVRRHRSD
jgi:hypothetical protein